MPHTAPLMLVPTSLERDRLVPSLPPSLQRLEWQLVGFGPLAAAATTMHWLHVFRPSQVVLVGIAGTYNPDALPVGSATTFSRVVTRDVGAWQDDTLIDAQSLGFPMWAGLADPSETPLGQRIDSALPLVAAEQDERRTLLTVAAASGSRSQAQTRVAGPDAPLAEDMEGFGVALACHLLGIPLTILRGISNIAGNRNAADWKIEPALASVASRLTNGDLPLPVTP